MICDEQGTRPLTPEVRPQPDGVHVLLDNRTGEDLGVSFDTGFEDGGDNADEGTTEHVWLAPPGRVDLACSGHAEQTAPQDGASFTVVDPDGLWVSPDLGCDSGRAVASSGAPDATPPKGDPRNPVEIAGERFGPLRPDERLEEAGYPKGEPRIVRLTRDGRTIAYAEYVDASFAGGEPGSGWIENGYQECQDR